MCNGKSSTYTQRTVLAMFKLSGFSGAFCAILEELDTERPRAMM
jgi:hypothetical protein